MPNKADKIQEFAELVNAGLDKLLPAAGESIVCEAMRYSVENGGKRIRPVLTLEFCRLCGGKPEDALAFACAVEMIHAYSLIHDDLPCMDNDNMRRGKPSCHIEFGEANALLAGDALLTLAFETLFNSRLAPEKIIEAGSLLAAAAGWAGMIGGQVMDLQNEGKTVPLDDLVSTDMKKTGKLIMAAAVLGCIAAGAEENKKTAAADFAGNIGLAFQLVDDILDVTGDEAILGKPVGSDDENQKSTYISTIGIKASQAKVIELTQKAKTALGIFGEDSAFLLNLADSLAKRNK
jgi:geranylgeranyl diphosphate synthase type II